MNKQSINFNIISNSHLNSKKLRQKLCKDFIAAGYEISSKSKNIIICGGDGTFVSTFAKYYDKDVRILMINTGFVGFYAVSVKPIIKDLVSFFKHEENFNNPNLVSCQIGNEKIFGINEIVLHAVNTLTCQISINNLHYEYFRGSGLCFSTNTGSTGYNKSLKGSIILPTSKIWQLAEISPTLHAKHISIGNSLILEKNHTIQISNIECDYLQLVVDGITKHITNFNKPITLKLEQNKAKIAFNSDLGSYLSKIKKVFIGENNGKL